MKVKDLLQGQLTESLNNFTNVGIPAEFAQRMLRLFNFKHDAPIEPIGGKPKTSELARGSMVINVLPNNDVVAVLKSQKGGRIVRAYDGYDRITFINGEFKATTESSLTNAAKGMNSRGQFFIIKKSDYTPTIRGDKPTADEIRDRSTSDALAGSTDNIYGYMNDTFMPSIRPQMENMIDSIYAVLRKLNNTRMWLSGSTDQEYALRSAKAIENIASRGFTRDTMEEFLGSIGKRSGGFGSIIHNERELSQLLKTDPLARAKWAKHVLNSAKSFHRTVMDMVK